jgi:hypothetical protein
MQREVARNLEPRSGLEPGTRRLLQGIYVIDLSIPFWRLVLQFCVALGSA